MQDPRAPTWKGRSLRVLTLSHPHHCRTELQKGLRTEASWLEELIVQITVAGILIFGKEFEF